MKRPRWITRLSHLEKRLWTKAFVTLLEGKALPVDGQAEGLGRLLDEGRVVLNEAGNLIVVAAGVSLIPTQHRLVMGGRLTYVSCALDAVGIPSALAVAARVNSACHECGRQLEYELPRDLKLRGPRVWVCDDLIGRSFVEDT